MQAYPHPRPPPPAPRHGSSAACLFVCFAAPGEEENKASLRRRCNVMQRRFWPADTERKTEELLARSEGPGSIPLAVVCGRNLDGHDPDKIEQPISPMGFSWTVARNRGSLKSA